MILTLHGVFLAYLVLLFAWNVVASTMPRPEPEDAPGAGDLKGAAAAATPATAPATAHATAPATAPAGGERARARARRTAARLAGPRGGWERAGVLPIQGLLTAALVVDCFRPHAPSLLNEPWLMHLFPVLFLVALVQNAHCLVQRGPRLTDIPVILCNVGLGACAAVGALSLAGAPLGNQQAVLLYDHSLLQHLLGNPLAHLSTLSWHLPVLARRAEARSIAGALAGLVVAAGCAFIVLMLVVFHREAGAVLDRFHDEPLAATAPLVRSGLATGVLADPRPEPGAVAPRGTGNHGAPPGSLSAWVLAADDDGRGLVRPRRPLVLSLRAPAAWALSVPDAEEVFETFLRGAERLAADLQPAVLLPFPEPDGEATLYVGAEVPPERWRALHEEARRRVRAVSPETRIAARLVNPGERTRALHDALVAAPACVDILGPRLQPGNGEAGGPAHADTVLATWTRWRAEAADTSGGPLPELWVLSAGLSPLAYGSWAQLRFVEGCLVRAARDAAVRGILLEAWEDRDATLGLRSARGVPRPAAVRVQELLVRP